MQGGFSLLAIVGHRSDILDAMKPAARTSDMHVCPMQTPGTPPIPHVGGPILPPGEPTVLINGLPPALVGSMAVCVGPPDSVVVGSFTCLAGGKPMARLGDQTAHGGTISVGSPNVMIGDSGGAGSPQAATMSAAKAAGSPFVPANCATAAGSETQEPPGAGAESAAATGHWIELELVDKEGNPVPHERFRVVTPAGETIDGFLDSAGFARLAGLDPGQCTITFPDLDAGSWAPASGDPGRRVDPSDPDGPKPVPLVTPTIGTPAAALRDLARPSVAAASAAIIQFERPGISLPTVEIRREHEPGIETPELSIRTLARPSIGEVGLTTGPKEE